MAWYTLIAFILLPAIVVAVPVAGVCYLLKLTYDFMLDLLALLFKAKPQPTDKFNSPYSLNPKNFIG